MNNWTRTSRIIRARRDVLFQAFIDPVALCEWLPPGDMRATVHAFDARVGGGYEMSLAYPPSAPANGKTAPHEDRVQVRFVEIVPPARLVESVQFVSDDVQFAGKMTLIVTFEPVTGGTDVTLLFKNLPPGLRPQDNEAGARQSLAQLARRCE